jgi:surfeit locus 1 family protein
MLQRLRQACLIWPTVLALAGTTLLAGLGTWQLERKRWKEDLLRKIAARVSAEPMPLHDAEQRIRAGGDVEYLHVSAIGRFLHDKERYVYAPTPAGLAWHVYTPLEIADGRIVWINRGAVPDARKDPARRAAGQITGLHKVSGLVRLAPRKPTFAPTNNPAQNVWYWPELSAMTASSSGSRNVDALPFVIDADARPEPPGGLPKGGVTRIALPNRHLEYALTWYGVALALLGVYLSFAFNRLRAGQER